MPKLSLIGLFSVGVATGATAAAGFMFLAMKGQEQEHTTTVAYLLSIIKNGNADISEFDIMALRNIFNYYPEQEDDEEPDATK